MVKNLAYKIFDAVILLTAFLYGLNIKNKASVFCMLLFILAFACCVGRVRYQMRISKFGLVILSTLITYSLIACLYTEDMQQVIITYLVLPMSSYTAGYLFTLKKTGDKQIDTKVICCISVGLACFGILNVYQRYASGYNALWWIAAGRMCVNYWTGEDMWPTLEATYFLPLCSLMFYAWVINKNILYKLMYSVAVAVMIWAAFDIGSRAIVLIPMILSTIFLFFYLKKNRVAVRKKTKLITKILMIIVVIAISYQSNLAGIKTTVEASSLYSRMTGKTYDNVDSMFAINGREDRYFAVIQEMPTHLLGGIDLGGIVTEGGLGSAHNTWLDIYRVTGIIPFLLFIICTVMLLKRISYLIRWYSLFDHTIMPLISILIVLNIQFLSESMFVLNTQLLNFYFLLCGTADSIFLSVMQKNRDSNSEVPIVFSKGGYQ